MRAGSPAAGIPPTTAIVAAMPEELAALRLRTTDAEPIRKNSGAAFEFVTARLAGLPVVLAVTGDGDRNAREGIAALLATVPVERLIAIGVAGALSPDLDAGALVVSERVSRAGAADSLHADTSLVDRAVRRAGARPAVVVTTTRIIDTVPDKQRLLGLADAGRMAAVVDLESAAYAGAAGEAGIPWIVLRAVSDTAHEALPGLLNRCRDDGGAVRRARVALALLRDPGALPVLLSLRQRVQHGAGVLARATEAILFESVPYQPPLGHRFGVSHGGI